MGEETESTFLWGLKGGRGQDGPHTRAVLEIPRSDKQSVLRTFVSFCILLVQKLKALQSFEKKKKDQVAW